MPYTLKDFEDDLQLDPEEVAKYERQIRDEIRQYELRDARKKLGLTQGQLAERMGVNQTRVSAIEIGGAEHTMVETLRKYMQALGGSLDVVGTLPDGQHIRFA